MNYHDRPEVSFSSLADLAKSPAHYFARHVAKTAKREETPAMRFGSAFHAAVLEPRVYSSRYVVHDWDARKPEGKARRDAVLASGATVLDPDDVAKIEAMRTAVFAHPDAARILDGAEHVEREIFWSCPTTGIACRGKVDLVSCVDGRRAIVDVKSTEDASPSGFSKSIANFLYHVQAATYLEGWNEAMPTDPASSFVFIAVEKSAPHVVAVYELDEEAVSRGAARRLELMDLLAECRASSAWPGYVTQTIGLPAWAR